MKKNKNISKTIPNGRTVQTRDEFIAGGKNTKSNHPNKNDLFRKTVVLDSNRAGDLVLVKLTTKGRHALPNYQKGKSTYNAYVVIQDDKGNSIRIDGVKFKENKSSKDVSKKDVNKIKKDCLTNPKTSKSLKKENKSKFRKVKGRK